MATPNFIKGAIKRPGALTAKARAAGMSVDAFARKHQHDKGVTGDEARMYLNVLKPGAAVAADKEDAAEKPETPGEKPDAEDLAEGPEPKSEREAAARYISKRKPR